MTMTEAPDRADEAAQTLYRAAQTAIEAVQELRASIGDGDRLAVAERIGITIMEGDLTLAELASVSTDTEGVTKFLRWWAVCDVLTLIAHDLISATWDSVLDDEQAERIRARLADAGWQVA